MGQKNYALDDGYAVAWVREGRVDCEVEALRKKMEAAITPCYHSLEQFK